jgi:molybdenum-dependent DNA-binding transcriptional regulator ModE
LLKIEALCFALRNNQMDRLQAWAIFAAVAELGSFADAARRLGRSPAAVTRAIAALENHLSTRSRKSRRTSTSGQSARKLRTIGRT